MPPRRLIQLKSPQERVHSVCTRMLRSRLKAIVRYLPLAADKWHEDAEHVHQLRIWTRRADAVVKLCRKLLRKKDRHELDSMLDVLRTAAGAARDSDVLRDHIGRLKPGLGREYLLKTMDRRRRTVQQPIASAKEELSGGLKLLALSANIAQRFEKARRDKPFRRPFREWATGQLDPLLKRFIKRGKADLNQLTFLHRFRIAGKRLRYALELVWEALDKKGRKRVYRQLDRLQARLGTINDNQNLIREMEQALAGTTKRTVQTQLRRVLAAERRRLSAARESWQQWWSDRRRKRLQKQLRQLRSVSSSTRR